MNFLSSLVKHPCSSWSTVLYSFASSVSRENIIVILDHIRGEREAQLWFSPSLLSELYIHWRPFKETWCVQRNHLTAVHPFSMLLQSWCLHALCDSEVGITGACWHQALGGQFRDHALCWMQSASDFLLMAQLTPEFLTFSENVTSATSQPSLGCSPVCYGWLWWAQWHIPSFLPLLVVIGCVRTVVCSLLEKDR